MNGKAVFSAVSKLNYWKLMLCDPIYYEVTKLFYIRSEDFVTVKIRVVTSCLWRRAARQMCGNSASIFSLVGDCFSATVTYQTIRCHDIDFYFTFRNSFKVNPLPAVEYRYLQWNVAACVTSELSASIPAVEYSCLSFSLTRYLSAVLPGTEIITPGLSLVRDFCLLLLTLHV
jgi:hypothetical protein